MRPKKGVYYEQSLIPTYVDWLVDHFHALKGIEDAFVIDCGNGVGGAVIPLLVKKMNWPNVQLLYCEVDGTYPNHEADPVKPENMQQVKELLETTDLAFGIGLDGDADRMAPMTKKGILVPGDYLLGLFAKDIVKNRPGAAVVFDIKVSSALIEVHEHHQW